MAKSHLRGHEIEFINNQWQYVDNGESTVKTHKDRPCGKCGAMDTKDGHDACLGTLPGLINACCSHGITKHAYVQFLDGVSIHGSDAIEIINILKKHKIV